MRTSIQRRLARAGGTLCAARAGVAAPAAARRVFVDRNTRVEGGVEATLPRLEVHGVVAFEVT